MKFWVVLAALAASLVVAAPSAAFHLPATGTGISLFAVSAPSSFAADTPFFIRHGNVCAAIENTTKLDCLNPETRFELIVDGEPVQTAVDLHVDNETGIYTKVHLANFRFGLPEGWHVFTGNWYFNGTLFFSRTISVHFH